VPPRMAEEVVNREVTAETAKQKRRIRVRINRTQTS
jgi:hypothetical protein